MAETPTGTAVDALLNRIREDTPITRRDYLRVLVAVSGGLLAGSIAVAVGAFRRYSIGTAPPKHIASSLRPGEAVYFNYPAEDDQAIAMRLADGSLAACSAICTHLKCSVLWRPASQQLECPCHNGAFDAATGDVVAGPPPRPLPKVILQERPDGIWAIGTKEV